MSDNEKNETLLKKYKLLNSRRTSEFQVEMRNSSNNASYGALKSLDIFFLVAELLPIIFTIFVDRETETENIFRPI